MNKLIEKEMEKNFVTRGLQEIVFVGFSSFLFIFKDC